MENRDGQHNEGATSSRPATEEDEKSATARGKASVEKEVVDEEEEKQKKSKIISDYVKPVNCPLKLVTPLRCNDERGSGLFCDFLCGPLWNSHCISERNRWKYYWILSVHSR